MRLDFGSILFGTARDEHAGPRALRTRALSDRRRAPPSAARSPAIKTLSSMEFVEIVSRSLQKKIAKIVQRFQHHSCRKIFLERTDAVELKDAVQQFAWNIIA
jgi:hypothetical protein